MLNAASVKNAEEATIMVIKNPTNFILVSFYAAKGRHKDEM